MNRLCLLAVAGLCVMNAAGCQVNPATGRSQLIMISPQQVSALGAEAKPELIKEYGGEVKSPQLRAYVDGIGRSLLANVEGEFASLDWSFTVLDSDVINAFALPGGHVFISRGLLVRFQNEAQVAGVLGHEIGHVTGRHVDERISQSVLAQGIVAGIGGFTESQLAVLAATAVAGGYQLKFGRDQESEADILGVRYMVQAGYDPVGMLEVLSVLKEAAGGGKSPEFLSTHPHPETRINTITRLVNGEYAYTQNNPQYQKHQQRFQQLARPHLGAAPTSWHPLDAAYALHMLGGCGETCDH